MGIKHNKLIKMSNKAKIGNIPSEKKEDIENDIKEENKQNEVIDFDYSLIEPLLKNIHNKKKNIILLTTGSYNPIHRMHLEILNIAYSYLVKKNEFNIVCGFISPSADCYVKHKQPPLIPFDKRCEIIEKAIEEYQREKKENQFTIFLHKWEGSHNYFIDFPEVINEIQKQLSKFYDIKLVYVCGMDLYLKCGYYLGKNVIAVDRKPFKKHHFSDEPKKLIFIIKDENSEPYSSTSIRKYYKEKKFDEIVKATFRGVAKMIIDYYESINY